MNASRRVCLLLASIFVVLLGAQHATAQCVSLTTLGSPSTQNFTALANAGTNVAWTDNSTIPGWYATRTTYNAGTGSSNAGAMYSFGVAGVNPLTDRALGGVASNGTGTFFWAACFTNNTGAALTSADIAYIGEQWRDGLPVPAAAQTITFEFQVAAPGVITDADTPTTGWTAVPALDFTGPVIGTAAGALDGNAAPNRTARAATITTAVPVGNQFWVRWRDINDASNDHGLAVDDFSITPQGGPPPNPPVVPTCPATVSTTFGSGTTAPVSATDANGTVTSATITSITPSDPGTITLIGFTPAGGVGGTANATLDVSNTTPAGSYNVTIQWANNDGVPQTANCIVAVNVTAPVVIVAIHDVQGNGTASPLAGNSVSIRGIVTLLKSNGFFLQEELADYDADPNTSEGIFVFTSSAPTVAVGDDATVTGTVVEFNGLTEISPVTNVTTNSTGNTLPTAIPLTLADLPPSGNFAQPQLEKYEGMRLSAASLTTVAPNDNFFDVFTVLTAQPRPFREPGIPASDPIPPDPTSGLPDPNIPIWDENPERLSVDTNGRAGSTGETLTSNVTLTNVAGPLDFSFSAYRLINEAPLTRTADMSAAPVPTPAANEFTVAGYNIENFNNAATQRQKAALTIRDVLLLPDVIGAVEIFDLADLQALATEIQTISGATYSAHLIEQDGTSEDSDQDVGFLVKTTRVSVTSVTAERTADTFINPNTSLPETLHDRPPLVLRGTVDPLGPNPLPIIVVVNHTRSFIDIELVAGEGVRVRAKRKAQAESLADLMNDLQTDNPGTPVIWVGDYNAFQFNNGYDDPISVIKGMPTPDDQIVVDQSPDLVNPDAYNLIEDVPADQRYSFIFEGTPQALDHFLVNPPAHALNTGIAVARVNADYPSVSASVYASNAARPEGNSDHDPVVGYFVLLLQADLDITKTDSPDPVNAGTNLTYTITVTNSGPDVAATSSWSDTIPAGTTFVSLSSVAGWSCSDPGVGNNGLVSCSNPSFAVGSAVFTLVVHVDPTVAAGTVLSNTATATSATSDPDSADLSDTETTTVAASADLVISKTDSPDPVTAGQNLTYQMTITNNGPSNAASATFSDTLPAGTTFVSLSTTGPWSCTDPGVGNSGTVSCTNTSFGVTVDFFTIVVNVDPSTAAGTVLSNTATVGSSTPDPSSGNESDTATTTVAASADLQISKTDTPDPVDAGSNITYQITLTNNGPSNAASATFSDTLPAGTTFVSLSTTGSWSCTTPAVGATGTVSCTNTSFGVTVDFFTLVVQVDPSVAAGTVLSNTATLGSATSDPNTGNESDTATTTVATAADLSVTKTDSPDPVTAGTNLTYTITVTNAGPSIASTVALADTIPANTTFVSLSSPGGWSCTTPAVGGTGTVNCSIASLGVTNAVFTLVVNVNSGTANATILSNTATVSSTTSDPNTGNESATANTTVGVGSADVSVTKTDSPDPISAGSSLTYTITVANAGPSDAANVTLSDTVPAGTTFINLQSPGGWSCATPGVGGTGTINCSIPSFLVGGNAVFTLLVQVNDSLATGTVITNTATITSTTGDPDGGDNSSTTTTTVMPITNFTATKAVSGTFVSGSTVTYTVVLTNNMGHTQQNNFANEFADILPAGLALTGATASSGTILTILPSNIVTWNGSIPNATSVTITITATITATSGTVSNQGNAIIDTDNSGLNESAVFTDDPSTAAPGDPTVFTVISPATVTGTKSASGSFQQGSNVTYTVVLSNSGPAAQNNNPGDEFVDVLPSQLTLISANATTGTAVANVGTNTVTWNGSIPAGGSVTITIVALVEADVPVGTTVTNQGTINSDTDGDGTNEPGTGTTSNGAGNPFIVGAPAAALSDIPALDPRSLMVLATLLAAIGVLIARRS